MTLGLVRIKVDQATKTFLNILTTLATADTTDFSLAAHGLSSVIGKPLWVRATALLLVSSLLIVARAVSAIGITISTIT